MTHNDIPDLPVDPPEAPSEPRPTLFEPHECDRDMREMDEADRASLDEMIDQRESE